MHAKNNRLNKDFQIAYFLAGSCHTPDGAYSLLCDLRESRSDAIKHAAATALRVQAKRVRAQQLINSDDEAVRLDGHADLVEIDATLDTANACYAAAVAELATIDLCIERVQPLRKFAHLSAPQAHEAAQFDEWKLELISRGENYLMAEGRIPMDHFATMRQHPAFATDIYPALEAVKEKLRSPAGIQQLLAPRADGFDIQKLIAPEALQQGGFHALPRD
ncbi:MAG: hypothetical protein V4631_20880 [Pseudomonadota bacterium]